MDACRMDVFFFFFNLLWIFRNHIRTILKLYTKSQMNEVLAAFKLTRPQHAHWSQIRANPLCTRRYPSLGLEQDAVLHSGAAALCHWHLPPSMLIMVSEPSQQHSPTRTVKMSSFFLCGQCLKHLYRHSVSAAFWEGEQIMEGRISSL